jgi:hypothetical protein
MNPIQQYYNLERNAEINWFWDEGFEILFGDHINGYTEVLKVDTWEEVENIFKQIIGGIQCN